MNIKNVKYKTITTNYLTIDKKELLYQCDECKERNKYAHWALGCPFNKPKCVGTVIHDNLYVTEPRYN